MSSRINPVGRRRGWIYFMLFLLSVVAYIDRVSISIGAKPIADEFQLSPTAMGYVLSAFFWSYLLCLVPIGMVADRIGSRTTIGACIGVWGVMTGAGGLTSNLWTLVLTRLGVGAGESAVFPAGGRVMREWAPASERGLVSTIFIAGSYAGPAFGSAFLAYVVSTAGWRMSFLVAGALGLVYFVVWIAVYRRPEDARWLGEAERAKILAERGSAPVKVDPQLNPLGIRDLLRSKSMWGVALAHGCGIYSQYLYLTWLPTYLINVRGLTLLSAGFYTALPYLVAAVVNVGLGWLSDRTTSVSGASRGQRRLLLSALKIVSAVILFIPFIESTLVIMLLITVSLSALSASISLHYALMHDLLERAEDAGKASSLVAFGGNTFGLMAPIATGYIITWTGSYNYAFVTAGVLLLLGAVLLLVWARTPIGAPGRSAASRTTDDAADGTQSMRVVPGKGT